MCLITKQQKPIKTRKDLITYKVVQYSSHFGILSTVKHFRWNLNELYKTNIEESKNPKYCGQRVYDAYLEGYDAGSLDIFCEERGYKVLGQGFHCFSNRTYACEIMSLWESMAKCVIPAGSLVYKDKTGLIVSNQIIMTEIL